jgi:U3 small nucleolar RNA-associated protein 3
MQSADDESDGDDNDEDGDYSEEEMMTKEETPESDDEDEQASDAPPNVASSDEDDEDEIARNVLSEARFGLRQHEVGVSAAQKRVRRAAPSDFGDEEVEETQTRKATQKLASTINAIEQRSATKKRKISKSTEGLDEAQEDDDALRRGLEMMEAAIGKDSDDEAGGGEEIDDELDSDDGSNDFYEQIKKKSKAKKEFKKGLYQVAPKYPNLEQEVEGERAISRQILKNRGLVAHKAKINRNPRVKKREQYRKALIRRKGKVRDIRMDEGHKYGGETTGIKSGLSRSRKLGIQR